MLCLTAINKHATAGLGQLQRDPVQFVRQVDMKASPQRQHTIRSVTIDRNSRIRRFQAHLVQSLLWQDLRSYAPIRTQKAYRRTGSSLESGKYWNQNEKPETRNGS